MANPVLKGSSDPQLQYWEIDFSPTQGGKLVYEYKGIDLGKMSALCNQAAIGGYSGKLRFEKSVATLQLETTKLSGRIPGGINSPASDITDKWEISVDQEKPELFENKNFLGQITTMDATFGVAASQQLIQAIRQVATTGTQANAWKNFLDTIRITPVVDASGVALVSGAMLMDVVPGAYLAGMKYFFDDYVRGRTNYVHGKYLLRHTTSAPSDFGANQADFNVENIYTIAQLLTECQSNTLWYLPLPGYLAYKILSYPVPANMPPNYAWGALKMGSGAVTAARNRVEITTEYLIDACPKHTYDLIS
jgi:hypothetical protein